MTAIAVDISGSVGGNTNYWAVVDKIYNQHKSDGIIIVLWDSDYLISDENTLKKFIASKKGVNGTSPIKVVEALAEQMVNELILITDGEVSAGDVAKMDSYMEANKIHYRTVHCHIVNRTPNLSVTCPLTRGNTATVVTYAMGTIEGEVVVNVSEADYDLLNQIDTLSYSTFMERYDTIHTLLLNLNMGRVGQSSYRDELARAKNRMTKEIAALFVADGSFLDRLKSNDVDGALCCAQKLCDEYYGTSDIKLFTSKIDRLINIASGMKGVFGVHEYSHNIQSNAMATAASTVDVAIDDITPEELLASSSEGIILCPIILDEDVPVIVVTDGKAVLEDVDKAIVDNIARCPLSLLNYPDICLKIKQRLSHSIGVTAYIEIQKQQQYNNRGAVARDPFTMKEITGCIPLGLHEQHIQHGNHTIATLFSHGKILGNLDLYYTVLWYLAKEEDIYLHDSYKAMSEHLIYRMRTRQTFASLSGLPNFVTTRIPLACAVWFVLVSGVLRIENEGNRPLRAHAFHTDIMLAMMDIGGYVLPRSAHRNIVYTCCLLRMLSWCKRDEKQYRTAVRKLYQNHVVVSISAAADNDDKDVTTEKVQQDYVGAAADAVGGVFTESQSATNDVMMIVSSTTEEVVEAATISEPVLKPTAVTVFLDGTPTTSSSTSVCSSSHYSALSSQEFLCLAAQILWPNNSNSQQCNDNALNLSADKLVVPTEEQMNQFPTTATAVANTIALTNWNPTSDGVETIRVPGRTVSICKHTCRPYYNVQLINDDGTTVAATWKEAASRCYPNQPFVSVNQRFGQYVCRYKKYPSNDELLVYCYQRQVNKYGASFATLPNGTVEDIAEIMKGYTDIIAEIDVSTFAKRFVASNEIADRVIMETL